MDRLIQIQAVGDKAGYHLIGLDETGRLWHGALNAVKKPTGVVWSLIEQSAEPDQGPRPSPTLVRG
jgi:hypothetical protein